MELQVDTFCINVFDQYDNESEKKCTQSSEFDNFIFEFNDGSGSYLMSFPYLSNDDNSLESIFSSNSRLCFWNYK